MRALLTDRGDIDPITGERLLVVPQAYSYLWRTTDARSVIGKHVADVPLYPTEYGFPCWTTYTDDLPGCGYGLIVVREDTCARGPAHWDSSD